MVQKEHVVKMHFYFRVILLILCLSPTVLYSQTGVKEASFKSGDAALRKFLLTELDKIRRESDLNVCLISVTFAKFSIDSAGNIKNVLFSEAGGTPPIFRNILRKVIVSTNGLWNPKKVNNVFVESKPFILPFIYQMEAGCYINKKTVNNGTDTALLGIMEFEGENKNADQFECTLLKPIVIFSTN